MSLANCSLATRFRKYCRTILAGPLVFAGTVAASVVTGSLSAPPAAAATPPAWTAYVVSYNNGTVIPVNTATHAVGTPITVGSGPSAIAITPDASIAYVTNEGTTNTSPGSVTPIDLSTNTPGLAIPVGSGPDAIAITPNGLTAYVGNYNDNTVTPIDLVTNTAGTPIPVGAAPTSITITPDGATAYVGLAFSSGIRLDLATNSIVPGSSPSGFSSAITPDGATLFATSPQNNEVNVFSIATSSGTPVAALNFPRGIAVTPDGSTAYVAYRPFASNEPSLLPIPLANPVATGTPIPLASSSAEAVAITPDGSTAFVTDLTGGTVVPVDLASGTAGTPISLGSSGTNPIAIAITPDQAPIAHVHVTILGNLTDTFDASSSTVAYGTIASYAWDFGDGTTDTTTTPTVTHTFAQFVPGRVASVTETSSTGTSTAQVFTGQTASTSGSPQATARATVYLDPGDAFFYPTVSAVSPPIGSPDGPTTVTITGSSFWPGQTEVYVGGIAAANVTVNPNETSLTATLPAQAAGIYDIIVTSATTQGLQYYFGSSAATPAARFNYAAGVPPIVVPCTFGDCTIPVVQYGSTSVSATVGSDCNGCTYSASAVSATPATCEKSLANFQYCCPNGMAFQQPQITVGEGGPNITSPLSAVAVSQFSLTVDQLRVCAYAASFSTGASALSADGGPNASTLGGLGKNIRLRKCAKKAVPPCLQSVVANGTTATTSVLLPVNESITLTIGAEQETIKKLSPKKGAAPGSLLTITGKNLNQVTEVYIDGVPAGGRLLGGIQAPIVSKKKSKLVVTIPPGASTGLVTLIGPSGNVTSSSTFTVN